MAAPHVSGAIAAFLSVRSEFKGRPEQVKDIMIVRAATNLKRRPEFQGGARWTCCAPSNPFKEVTCRQHQAAVALAGVRR